MGTLRSDQVLMALFAMTSLTTMAKQKKFSQIQVRILRRRLKLRKRRPKINQSILKTNMKKKNARREKRS